MFYNSQTPYILILQFYPNIINIIKCRKYCMKLMHDYLCCTTLNKNLDLVIIFYNFLSAAVQIFKTIY
jgi:hypothetical protein